LLAGPSIRALQQELDGAIQSTKEMAAKIRQASELWELEYHLTQLRMEIDRKYEYKYSTLVLFFADLVREGKLELRRLARSIRRQAPLHSPARGKICSLKSTLDSQ
jgi:hypothetical protein